MRLRPLHSGAIAAAAGGVMAIITYLLDLVRGRQELLPDSIILTARRSPALASPLPPPHLTAPVDPYISEPLPPCPLCRRP